LIVRIKVAECVFSSIPVRYNNGSDPCKRLVYWRIVPEADKSVGIIGGGCGVAHFISVSIRQIDHTINAPFALS
jgi:hypothetical protein